MALLDSYSGPWGQEQAAHLARRAGFGAKPNEIDTLINMGMDVAVDSADCKNHFCFRSDRLSLSPPAQRVRRAGCLSGRLFKIYCNQSLIEDGPGIGLKYLYFGRNQNAIFSNPFIIITANCQKFLLLAHSKPNHIH